MATSICRTAGRIVAALLVVGGAAHAQGTWSIDGKVQLGKRSGPVGVPGLWVVVHRITSDTLTGKVSGGPLDSSRTDGAGRFRIRFPHPEGEATYIAITSYSGVSYLSTPMSKPNTSGDDALIMVFDTTAPPYPIKIAGRHFILTSPDSGDRRRVIEVYELQNDSTLTVMGSEKNPVWSAPLPSGVTDLQLNPVGDINSGSAKQVGDQLRVFTPISPGLRQLSFTYTLPASAFPLAMPIVDSTSLFELLVQEPSAVVEGGKFTEVAAVVQDGIPFRRMLAQDIPPRTVVRFSVPAPVGRYARKGVIIVAVVVSLAMLAALAYAFGRRRRRPVKATAAPDPRLALIRELATLDADYERRASPTEIERVEFTARREALKARLNAVLAGPDQPA